MRFRRSWAAVAATAAVLVSGLVPTGGDAAAATGVPAVSPGPRPAASSPATRPAAPVRGELRWSARTCRPEVQEASWGLPRPALVECARMQVPLDHTRPSRGTIVVHVTRVRSAAPSRSTRTLFVNPGGPGVEAGWLAPALAARLPDLHRTHEIVAVDPRGTGGSTPVDCGIVPAPVGDLRNPGAADLRALQTATARTVSRCASAHGRVLPYISTAQTVADLDAVRARLRVSRVDWYGVSAGTWLGARYAQRYPSRIGRLVLDSTVDVQATWRASFAEQPRGFQRRYDRQFVPWVARHHATYGLGATPAAVGARIERLRAEAARGRLGPLVPADLDAVVAGSLYLDDDFPRLAEDLATLADGASASELRELKQEAAEELTTPQAPLTAEDTVFMAVQCNDFAWSRGTSSYVEEGRRLGAAHPLIGWTWLTSPCATWPYRSTPLPALRRHSLPVGMVLQNELDPATPWEGARRVWRAQRNLRVVAVDDEGSHGVLFGDNTCAVRQASAYLARGVVPRGDVVCRGRALPDDRAVQRVGRVLTTTNLD